MTGDSKYIYNNLYWRTFVKGQSPDGFGKREGVKGQEALVNIISKALCQLVRSW